MVSVPFERNSGMLATISKAIDTFNIKQGDISSLLAIPLLVEAGVGDNWDEAH